MPYGPPPAARNSNSYPKHPVPLPVRRLAPKRKSSKARTDPRRDGIREIFPPAVPPSGTGGRAERDVNWECRMGNAESEPARSAPLLVRGALFEKGSWPQVARE